MGRLFSFCFTFVLSLLLFSSAAMAEVASIDDLLNPVGPSLKNVAGINKELVQKSQQKIPMWDDLLGPEDNFPFLPDNHRDSGTGKFNAFN